MESVCKKDITNVRSFQLHIDIDINLILNHFPLSDIMIIESTCQQVKELDLNIIKTACKLIRLA